MELRVITPKFEKIEFNNEEIKAEVAEKVSYYNTLVYTDDQIKDAKADRAKLNKFVTALEDKRKEIKKQCMAPYEEFEKKIKEITAIVNEPIAVIDKQVKEYEEKVKAEKKNDIERIFNTSCFPSFVALEQIWDNKWLNAGMKLNAIDKEIMDIKNRISNDMKALSLVPEYGFEAMEVYKTTLDLTKALEEAQRMSEIAKRKAEREVELARQQAEEEAKKNTYEEPVIEEVVNPETFGMNPPIVEEPRMWVGFQANLTAGEAAELKQFFVSRNIEFKAI